MNLSLVLVHACGTDSVTEPEPDPSVAAAPAPQADLDCGWYGRPCNIPPLVVSICRDVWQTKDDDGNCVCKYDWMEKDEDGWCRNKKRPDDGGGTGGGNTGEGSEGDSITFLVRVDCRTALIRNQTVTCAAETRNGTGRITYEWRFEPDRGGVRIWHAVPDLEPLSPVSERFEVSATSNIWEGKAAHGGVVTVEATDSAGNTDEATTDFTVAPRGWKIDASSVALSFARHPDDIEDLFVQGGDLVLNTNSAGDGRFGHILEGDGSFNDTTTAKVAEVGSGPNKGYWYVKSQGYYVDRRYRLNERLEPNGPREIPDASHGDTVDHWTYMARQGWDTLALLNGVIRHERYGGSGAKGHQGQIEAALTPKACGDAGTLIERVVTKSQIRADRLRAMVETAASLTFAKAAGHNNVHSNYSSWMVRYDAAGNIPPQHYFHTDAPEPGGGGAPPECDWTYF